MSVGWDIVWCVARTSNRRRGRKYSVLCKDVSHRNMRELLKLICHYNGVTDMKKIEWSLNAIHYETTSRLLSSGANILRKLDHSVNLLNST